MISICIPTYNREKKLDYNLAQLLDKCDERVEILVSDNHSNDQTNLVLAKHEEIFKSKGIKFRKFSNPYNLGVALNMITAFNNARNDWVLLLGDDDLIISKSIDEILNHVERHPGASFLHFDSDIKASEPIKCTTVDEFIFGYGSYCRSFWMSSYIFNKKVCQKYLSTYIPYGIASYAPHFMMALASPSPSNPGYIISSDIVEMNRDAGQKWAATPVAMGLTAILNSPLSLTRNSYVRLREDLFRHIPRPLVIWLEIYSSDIFSSHFQSRRWLLALFTKWFIPIVKKPRLLFAWLVVVLLNEFKQGRNYLYNRACAQLNLDINNSNDSNIFSRL